MSRQEHTPSAARLPGIAKCPTGIRRLDEITNGGLPRGRPTRICGGAGSGKTLLAAEFIVRGIRDYGQPGIFLSFEETADELAREQAELARVREADGNGGLGKKGVEGHADRHARI